MIWMDKLVVDEFGLIFEVKIYLFFTRLTKENDIIGVYVYI